MRLNLYDKALDRIAIIGEHFISCLWNEEYNSIGQFVVELQAIDEYRKKIKSDCYVGRDDRNVLMVIKTVVVKNNIITASGFLATRQLDDVAFVGTIDANSVITETIKNSYSNSTQYENIVIADSNIAERYAYQISHKSILGLCENMCKTKDIGFRPVKKGKQIIVEFYKPEINPNLRFSRQFGNLSDEEIVLSTQQFKNYAIVLGEGEGENRVRVDVDIADDEQRRELIVDAKDLRQEDGETMESYKSRLTARGNEKLLETVKTQIIRFLPSSADFGVKYDIGDILSVNLTDYNLKIQARISAFIQKEQRNKTTTTISVGSLTFLRGDKK